MEETNASELDLRCLAQELVEAVRESSDLRIPWFTSQVCCQSVVNILAKVFPSKGLSNLREELLKDVLDVQQCRDMQRFQRCLQAIVAVKEDAQQRSWTLHDDFAEIADQFTELDQLLAMADARVPQFLFSDDDNAVLKHLVEFYQMENRPSLRMLLLNCFHRICYLGVPFMSFMLTSVLPLELVRDLLAENASDVPKQRLTLKVLALLFCSGERPPYTYYDTLNADWIDWLLNAIDCFGPCHEECMNVLVAFNLHYTHPDENLLLQRLTERPAQRFMEKLLTLANREDDPVWPFTSDGSERMHSILKLTEDILSYPATSELLYPTDLNVLCDICLREVVNLQPGTRRTQYLAILVAAVNAAPNTLRLADIKEVVESLEQREENFSPEDKDIMHRLKTILISNLD